MEENKTLKAKAAEKANAIWKWIEENDTTLITVGLAVMTTTAGISILSMARDFKKACDFQNSVALAKFMKGN